MTGNSWLDLESVGTFLAGGVASALIRGLSARWWNRARPRIAVLSVDFSVRGEAEDIELQLDPQLLEKERRAPMLPSLNDRMSLRDLGLYLEAADARIAHFDGVVRSLDDLVSRRPLVNPGHTPDEQRRALLSEWVAISNSDVFAVAALARNEADAPAACKESHPDQWRSPERAHVGLERSAYILREIDPAELEQEIAVVGPIGVADRLRREAGHINMLRRFWIHMNEEDLRWLFAKTREVARDHIDDARVVLDLVKETVETQQQQYVRVQALVTNDGDRSVGVSAYAALALSANAQEIGVLDVTLQANPLAPANVVLVSGGEAQQLTFYSNDPLRTLRMQQRSAQGEMTGDQLRNLYDTRLLHCRVAITLTGFKKDRVTVSAPRRLGIEAELELMRDRHSSASA